MNESAVFHNYTYFMTTLLLVVGLYGVIGKRNLIKKLVGLSIFQTAMFLFFIYGATKPGATVPVWDLQFGTDAARYINPLPHVLILTAIVVSVATTGVALALSIIIYRRYGTLDEALLLERMKRPS
jgi:multicomponent Na+:H+ antiporter subunit C